MFQDEEQKVELPALAQLQSLGWEYIHGSDLSPESSNERQYYREVVLEARLTRAVKRINPWINEENLRKVVRELIHPKVATLMEANQSIWETLVHYQSVEQDLGKGRKGQTVKIIDFENPDNNEFLCANQFKVEGPNQNIVPDIVLFVNGLPLAVIECKSPYITNPMQTGVGQLLRYANRRHPHEDEGAERLFHYNQMMVSTHRDKARVGTLSSRMEHFLEWKDPYPLTKEQVFFQNLPDARNEPDPARFSKGVEASGDYSTQPDSQQILIAGLFTPKNFLDLIQNFTVFEPVEGRIVKKLARYQQFRAVHKTLQRIKTGTTRKERGGVIWHTQGSGKSLTMVFLAVKMRRDSDLRDYKLVFVTDRTQLDQQLTATFERAQGETVYHADSVTYLKELLSKDSSDLVTAMTQKFQENEDDLDFPELNASEKIIVLADEAHRTQYGTLGVAINSGLPHAPKIAFTGTPLIKSRKTHNEFGPYIDTYTIEQAVEDGATVQILYEGREAQTKVTGDSLDRLFEEYFQDKTDMDACVLSLEDEDKRQQFEIDFKKFAKQMDIILPDPAARPYLADLRFLGKVNHGARNRYCDSQLDLAGVGEKVRRLIDEHIRATGVDPKIPPVDLLATDFKQRLQEHKSDRAKASEIEHAIKHHIDINLEQDEEYYKSLSEKLRAIIEQHQEHWDELVQLLLDFRDGIESNRKKQADDLGLSETEFAFHNILEAEIARLTGNEAIDESTHDEVVQVTQDLVTMLDEVTAIVDFFNKQDEIRRVKQRIKRRILETSFDDPDLRRVVMDRFMELAQVKYKS
jgi:HsdR family type I site-specific deoxyribonuclease